MMYFLSYPSSQRNSNNKKSHEFFENLIKGNESKKKKQKNISKNNKTPTHNTMNEWLKDSSSSGIGRTKTNVWWPNFGKLNENEWKSGRKCQKRENDKHSHLKKMCVSMSKHLLNMFVHHQRKKKLKQA